MPHGVACRIPGIILLLPHTERTQSLSATKIRSESEHSREMIHLNSNVASSFSVFSICSIMVYLNHVCHIRSDGLSFLSSSLINFDFWKQQMTSLVRTIPFPLHFCFCVIGLRKEPAVAVDLTYQLRFHFLSWKQQMTSLVRTYSLYFLFIFAFA